jgi:hypothetical protein
MPLANAVLDPVRTRKTSPASVHRRKNQRPRFEALLVDRPVSSSREQFTPW